MNYSSLLRHHLATLAMRCGHALHNSKENFPTFEAGCEVKTPYDIMHHLANMIYYSNDCLNGSEFKRLERSDWDVIKDAFFNALETLDNTIKDSSDLDEKLILTLYQGPFNDAMTHVGQLAMLRRMHGSPIVGQNFRAANISADNLGEEQG